MWYYISHLGGGLFSSRRKLSLDDRYCEQCGDYDEELGRFATKEEAEEAYREYYRKYMDWDDDLEEEDVN